MTHGASIAVGVALSLSAVGGCAAASESSSIPASQADVAGDETSVERLAACSGGLRIDVANAAYEFARGCQTGATDRSLCQYRRGGQSPSEGMDCSGFTYYFYKTYAGIELGHSAQDQWDSTPGDRLASAEELRPGDLVFFTGTTGEGGITHVAVYTGARTLAHSRTTEADIGLDAYEGYWVDHSRTFRAVRPRLAFGSCPGCPAVKVVSGQSVKANVCNYPNLAYSDYAVGTHRAGCVGWGEQGYCRANSISDDAWVAGNREHVAVCQAACPCSLSDDPATLQVDESAVDNFCQYPAEAFQACPGWDLDGKDSYCRRPDDRQGDGPDAPTGWQLGALAWEAKEGCTPVRSDPASTTQSQEP